ncbi:MAG TPA: PASTA domain-containing protein [Solirubrobacteraceae bacterium]|nr:PASTA domain-containing protein [Solirubrobacteraceae bacterium]
MSTNADIVSSLRRRLVRYAGVAVAVGAVSLSAGSAVALADGAATIAGATPVAVGQLELGNTLNGGVTTDGLDGYESYWALNVVNGDNVTIDWQAPLDVAGNGSLLSAYEVGTTDANLADQGPVEADALGANGLDEMTFTADMTGVMPLQVEANECCSESLPGPYQFTATVTHAVVLTVPSVTSVSTRGTIDIGVANPDGVGLSDPALAVSLEVQAGGSSGWTPIGAASASAGTARIAYTVPAALVGRTVKLQAVAQGAAYQTQTSAPRSVSVVAASGSGPGTSGGGGGSSRGPSGGAACTVPSVVGKKLGAAKQALRGAGCKLGRVRHARAKHAGRGRILRQGVTAGSHVRRGAKISVVVGS